MTTATITTARSTFTTAPHHAHFSAQTSTFDSGGLEDAQIEWWCQLTSDGTVVDSNFEVPIFGVLLLTPGDYTITLRVKGAGDADWSEDSVEITVGTASYVAECWVDLDSVTDGAGTIGDPFNEMTTAFTYIATNWSDGAANEFAIHVKRGTSITTAAQWNSDTTPRQGRLVVDTYDSGSLPAITASAGNAFFLIKDENALAVLDLNFTSSNNAYLVRKDMIPTNQPNGLNVIISGCSTTTSGIFLTQLDGGATGDTDPANWTAGSFDFLAIVNHTGVSTTATVNGYQLAAFSRYVLYKDNDIDVYPTGGSIGIRFKTTKHLDMRGNHHEGMTTGVPVRIHSATANIETEWVAISDIWVNTEELWIGADDGNGTKEPIRHLWIVRSCVNAPTRNRAWGVYATERLVFRNNWGRCNGPLLTSRLEVAALIAYSNWTVENNSHVRDTNSAGGSIGLVLPAAAAAPTDITFRNNLVSAPNQTSNGLLMVTASGSPDPATVFAACDGNLMHSGAGTPSWASGFSAGSGNLATWQGATTFDDASSAAATADFVDVSDTGDGLDLHIGASSTAIGAAVATTGVYLDYNGNVRDATDPDAGSHDRAATDPPDAPVLGGGGGSTVGDFYVSDTGVTTFAEKRRQAIPSPFRKGPGPKWV